MNALKFMAVMGGVQPATLVTSSLTSLSTASPQGRVSLSGAAAGDLAVLVAYNNADGDFTTPSGWNADNTSLGGEATQVFSKVLDASDISTGHVDLTGASGGYHATSNGGLFVYRGPALATVRSTAAGSALHSLVIPGFTKDARSQGIATYAATGENSGLGSVPTGFTQRFSGSVSVESVKGADIAPENYTNGASVTWSGLDGSGAKTHGYLIELT